MSESRTPEQIAAEMRAKAMKLLEAMCEPCTSVKQTDEHEWRKCRRCLAHNEAETAHGIELLAVLLALLRSSPPPGTAVLTDGVGWMVIRKRETDPPEVYPFPDEASAREFHDQAQQQWSDCFLVAVVRHGMQPESSPPPSWRETIRAEIEKLPTFTLDVFENVTTPRSYKIVCVNLDAVLSRLAAQPETSAGRDSSEGDSQVSVSNHGSPSGVSQPSIQRWRERLALWLEPARSPWVPPSRLQIQALKAELDAALASPPPTKEHP